MAQSAKNELIDVSVMCLLHIIQAYKESRSRTHLLLSQCGQGHQWAKDWEVGLGGVYHHPLTGCLPSNEHVLNWACAIRSAVKIRYKMTIRKPSEYAAMLDAFVCQLCNSLELLITTQGSIPLDMVECQFQSMGRQYKTLIDQSVAGLKAPTYARPAYWARTNWHRLQQQGVLLAKDELSIALRFSGSVRAEMPKNNN